MPKENEEVLGGHAIMAVGYDIQKKVFIIQNSWGDKWGDNGYFYMPFDFITNKEWCSDFWTCSLVYDNINNSKNVKNIAIQATSTKNIKMVNNSTQTCSIDNKNLPQIKQFISQLEMKDAYESLVENISSSN